MILCAFPGPAPDVRRAILDRVNLLAVKGEAELLFVGSTQADQDRGTETIAVRLRSLERAFDVVDEWRSGRAFPAFFTSSCSGSIH